LDPLPEKLPVHDQSVVDSLPCRSTAEHEVVNAREQTQRRIPDRRRPHDLADARVVGELAPQPRVERRAPVGEPRPPPEDPPLERRPRGATGRLTAGISGARSSLEEV